MANLLHSLFDLIVALKDVVWSLGVVLIPWVALFAWVIFWTLGVNWIKLRPVLRDGGWVGLLLIGAVAVLVWGVIAPPPRGFYDLLGLHVSNFVGKTMYVTGLICLMLLSGSVQLSGAVNGWLSFPEEAPEDEHHGHGHDHDHGHAAAHH